MAAVVVVAVEVATGCLHRRETAAAGNAAASEAAHTARAADTSGTTAAGTVVAAGTTAAGAVVAAAPTTIRGADVVSADWSAIPVAVADSTASLLADNKTSGRNNPRETLDRTQSALRRDSPRNVILRIDTHVEVIVVNLVSEVVSNRVVEPPRASELLDVGPRHEPLRQRIDR